MTTLDIAQNDVSALVHRRAELRGRIAQGRRDLQALAFEFQRVDTAIREMKGSAAAGRRAQPQGMSGFTRVLFAALQAADGPVTSKALAAKIIAEMSLDASDRAVEKYIVRRVCVCLWEQVQKGHVKKSEPGTWPQKWERIRPAQ